MSSAAVEAADPAVGPLEHKHLRYANYRAVAGGAEITRTHWHIAVANGLGWGFDGMDGVMFALVSPLIIKEFALGILTYHSADRAPGRHHRALFLAVARRLLWAAHAVGDQHRPLSLLMPVVALSPTFAVFVAERSVVGFALTGEWSLGSMLVAETWPTRLRGRVISINRATWCFGAALAGAITGIAAAAWGCASPSWCPG